MSASINRLAQAWDSEKYFEDHWRLFFESHLSLIRAAETTLTVAVDPFDAYKFAGDFYGMLTVKEVPPKYHWAFLRVNQMTTPTEFGEQTRTLLFPSTQFIEELMSVYRNIRRKMN